MTKEEKEKYFKKQLPQIRGFAARFSKKYKMEYDEVESMVFERFCRVIDRYEKDNSSIYTFLYHQLRVVGNELLQIRKEKSREMQLEELEFCLSTKSKFVKVIEFYSLYKEELSNRARNVIEYILDDSVNEKKYSYNYICNYFCDKLKWDKGVFSKVWEEIKVWWNNSDFVYC
jgi:hypothetical protein